MAHQTFSAVTAVTATGDGQFQADLSPDWTIGGKPVGGYLLATMGRAAVATGQHPHVLAASAHFLRSPDPGPVVISVDILRAGRSASQLRVRLAQGDAVCVESLMTTGTLASSSTPYWSAGVPDPGSVSWDECIRVPAKTPTGLAALMMGEVDMRIDPSTFGFASLKPSGAGFLRGWLALPLGEDFDATSLLWTVDSFPPATFEVELTGWVPTLELTAYVRALPAPGPVRVLQLAHLVDDQRVDEACFIWDSTGRLVAQSTQLAAIRLG